MKTLNRRALQIAKISGWLDTLLAAVGAWQRSIPLLGIALALAFLSMILYMRCNSCPHCGETIHRVDPFANDPGFCRECGEKLEFDR